MTWYTPAQFHKDWVYAIDKDFHSADGDTPATWAPGQPTEWGKEHAKIPLPTKPATTSLNADESLLAVALDHDIHVYGISDLSLCHVLRGHISRVDALRFHPVHARMLVSCAMNNRGGSVQAEPQIVFWDLDEQRKQTLLSEATIHALGKRAVDGVVEGLRQGKDKEATSSPPPPPSPPSWEMDEEDKAVIANEVEKTITTLNVKSQVRGNRRITGRLAVSFDSQVFNSSGTSMAFLPGSRPRSNGDDQWDICIYDTRTHSVRLTLSAHRDAITWVGFSPDDNFFASVSWDRTFRIWDHGSGKLLHTFRSEAQNWTGAFSPDSRFFAATDGRGHFWVWDVVHGLEIVSQQVPSSSRRWCRALAWSPDGKRLVIGGQGLGRVFVFDLKGQAVVQERVLSTKESPELLQRMAGSFLEVHKVRYLDGGRMVAFKVRTDDGLEVYDFEGNRKWRFAPKQGMERSGDGGGFVVLEEKGMIASVDADAVRFWKVPFGGQG